jgi:uncharacterized protein YbjT (DUF2867 family)
MNAGATVVKAATTDMASLARAFSGAYGVFGLTQPWPSEKGKYDTQHEIIQGKNLIWACEEAGVSQLLFSSFFIPGEHARLGYMIFSRRTWRDFSGSILR